jgi:hypothetical protein
MAHFQLPMNASEAYTGRRRALDICRGVGRLLRSHDFVSMTELTLANGRRADILGVGPSGDIWIVEVKSCAADFMSDRKWPEYREHCDRLFFAVAPDFPVAVLPADAGYIVADRFGGEFVRESPETRLPPARRKALTLQLLRAAAFSLAGNGRSGWSVKGSH